ncbi:MAG TPA: recombination protein O N-terminal domain-containing protein [Candidatus Tyrphobacter sp.]|nr:recombination protein O N-terminal domain-containing protein [Candidatus Tyrphobacter sp.]
MAEFYTEGLVLEREIIGERDEKILIYTQALGKLRTIGRSVKKITSKLSGHLTAGNLIGARIVERNRGGFQIVDALSLGLKPEPNRQLLNLIDFLKRLVPENETDPGLWREIIEALSDQKTDFAYKELLGRLGFGSKFARCDHCHSASVDYFIVGDTMFLCASCLGEFLTFSNHHSLGIQNEVIKI